MGKMKEMEQRIHWAMQRTWGSIAPDCGDLSEDGMLHRDEVIELVVDADRLTTFGNDKEATDYFYSLDATEREKIEYDAFPCEHYEV